MVTKPSRKAAAKEVVSIDKVAGDFLQLLRRDGWQLTAIHPETGVIKTQSFASIAEARRWIKVRDGREGLYYTVNSVRSSPNKKPKKLDMAAGEFLHVDLDWAKGAEPETEDARILAQLTTSLPPGIPAPSAIIHSGGGYQALWRLEKPFAIDGEQARWEEFESYNRALAAAFGADHCWNCDRVLRLPGTWNLPNQKKRERGRVKVRSALVHFASGVAYPLTAFPRPSDHAPAASTTTKVPAPIDAGLVPRNLESLDQLDQWGVPALCREVISHGSDPDEPTRFASRSEAMWHVVCELVRRAVPDDLILGIVSDGTWRISEHVRAQKSAVRYALGQIAKAKAEVEAKAQDFQKNEDGFPYKNPHNIRVAIAKMGVQLSYDEFADKHLVSGLPGFSGGPLQDEALRRMWLRTEEEYKFLPSRELFSDVVMDLARRNSFHPLKDYLDGLEWDTKSERLDTWLTTYLGAEDTPFNRAVGAIVLMAAVRRVRQPGCKFDEVMVLEGREGTGRSTALAVLAKEDKWFTDNLSLQDDAKVIIENTAGKWIVEYGELEGIRKAEGEHVKRMLSRQVDEARLAYGRLVSVRPRQWIAIGTTNDDSYLKSFNGNRRFWPVKCGAIDLEGLARDRDQLWAEAAHREAQADASIRLPKGFWATARELQDERTVAPPNLDRLVEHLGWSRQGWIAPTDVYRLLGYKDRDPLPVERQGIGEALKKLGFERWKQRQGDVSVWTWWRGSEPKDKALQIEVTMGDDFRFLVAEESAEARSPRMNLPRGGPASRRSH